MKIIAISDTHGQHPSLILPPGDLIIHAGDCSYRGTEREIKEFLAWFSAQDYKYKIFIAGNHDFYFEKSTPDDIASIIPHNVIYLQDSGVTLEGIKCWGSPITPWFFDWAFNRHRGAEIKKHWDLIPTDIDILITHGPVYGMLDRTISGKRVGCEVLYEKVMSIQPKVHICGHIHEAYGQATQDETLFVNASVLDVRYRMVNEPIAFDI